MDKHDITSTDAFNTAVNIMVVISLFGFIGLTGIGILNVIMSISKAEINFISEHEILEGFGRLFIAILFLGLYMLMIISLYRSISKWLHERENP